MLQKIYRRVRRVYAELHRVYFFLCGSPFFSLCFSAVIFFFFYSCSTRKVEYAFPDDAKTYKGYPELMEHLEGGKKLYKVYCGKCHGVTTKGKNTIPNFSRVQLDNYNAAYIRKDPKNHAVAEKLSKDQLGDIILFLTFIKREKKTE